MLTIQKLDKGYGIFDGDRLASICEHKEDYACLVDTIITVNTKLEIERIKYEIEKCKRFIIEGSLRWSENFYTLEKLREDLHFLENYNV